MKINLKMAVALVVAITLVGALAAAEPSNKPSGKDNDGFTLFYLSLANADKGHSKTITVSGPAGERTIAYKDHVLSCGTWMNGQLNETTKDGKTFIKGSWSVTRNPYKITSLMVDLSQPANSFSWAGTIVVDGVTCTVVNAQITLVN